MIKSIVMELLLTLVNLFIRDRNDLCQRSGYYIAEVIFCVVFLQMFSPFGVGAESELPNNSTVFFEEYHQSDELTRRSEGPNLSSLFNEADQSVVHISEARSVPLGPNQGSGFVYDNQGHIVTNYYLVTHPQEGQQVDLSSREFYVTFADGTTYIGKVIGADLYSELAVIKIENTSEKRLIPLPLGNSSQLRIGQPVLSLGNPLGLSGSMTEGIVSGFGRILPSSTPQGDLLLRPQDAQSFLIPNLIQTDAAMNPGNLGGPLLNTAGEVVGMNTQFFSSTAAYWEVGSAIPSDIIRRVVPEVISTGAYRHPYIGIAGVDVSPGIAHEMGLNVSRGFLVTEVTSGSPAERSGIRGGQLLKDINGRQIELGGDVIIAVDNAIVRKIDDLISYVQSQRSVGETISLSVLRDGKIREMDVTVATRPMQRFP